MGFGIFAEVINDLCPSRGLPKLFPSSRTGMQNHVRSLNFAITPKFVGFFAGGLRKIKLRSGRSRTNIERLKQSEIVVDRVHITHADSDKISVNARASLGLFADPVRGDPSPCCGQESQKSRTIVSGKVDAIIKSVASYRRNHRNIPEIASRDENSIDVRDGRKQFSAFVRNREGDVRIWIVIAQGGNGWRRQNQIADSLELQEKNFHPPSIVSALSGRR